MQLVLALSLFFLIVMNQADAQPFIPTDAPNCNISSPPADAGEGHVHGAELRVYPRNKVVDAGYSGCQTVWFLIDQSWIRTIFAYYELGSAKIIILNAQDEQVVCQYQQSIRISGNREACGDSPGVLERIDSHPPGCYEKLSLAPPIVKECLVPD